MCNIKLGRDVSFGARPGAVILVGDALRLNARLTRWVISINQGVSNLVFNIHLGLEPIFNIKPQTVPLTGSALGPSGLDTSAGSHSRSILGTSPGTVAPTITALGPQARLVPGLTTINQTHNINFGLEASRLRLDPSRLKTLGTAPIPEPHSQIGVVMRRVRGRARRRPDLRGGEVRVGAVVGLG